MKLDHIIISVQNLPAAITAYRQQGFVVTEGGRHSSGTTENALIAFADGAYIELIAPTGEERSGDGYNYTVLVSEADGYTGFALLTYDLEADAADMVARDLPLNSVAEGSRQKPSGETLRWKAAMMPDTMSPFFIEDVTPRNLRVSDHPEHLAHPNGATAITDVTVITSPNTVKEIVSGYRVMSGTDPKLSDGLAIFPLDGFTITVRTATLDVHRQHVGQRGRAPFQITLRTTRPDVAAMRIHGARMAFTMT
ncbi:MAG: VOC family protein [Chloroflexota bacterium]